MKLPDEGILLRIFIGEGDMYHGKPLYETIVMKARELNIAGATVTRGILGYGADSRIHSSKFLRISEDLPVIIEIVDHEERIHKLIPFLNETVKDGLITQEKVSVLFYNHNSG
ncbi:DUF190 domain-containing protein [Fidelibacter multiformis]|uniref:DUF190 domain-containing protein n=1 Tax=Fidelibacter multiformis TaxID=3377529 RepID=UPI0037DD7D40